MHRLRQTPNPEKHNSKSTRHKNKSDIKLPRLATFTDHRFLKHAQLFFF